MDRPFGKHRQDTFADRGHAGLKIRLIGGKGWGIEGTEFELPDCRPRRGRYPLIVGGYTEPEVVCRNRSLVTDFVTDLVTAGRDEFCC
jgi:hypothetical protein